HAYVDQHGAPIVIKADGLAAGKGVVVAMSLEEAHEAIDFMLLDNKLGVQHNEGGARVVIEEFLAGEEASFIVLADGKNVAVMATSQDHKR
ncbi:phosphoribosylamine--glycine ligase, partial [Acinetobacter baumannii]